MTIGLAAGRNGLVKIAVGCGTSFLYGLRAAYRYLWLEDYAASARITPAKPAPLPARLSDGIEIQNLSFRYPGMDQPILSDVSFRLPAGSVVALVGENGAGKTTLVKLLGRFYEPDGGQILVDGVDFRRFPVEAWRARLRPRLPAFSRLPVLLRGAARTRRGRPRQ